MIPKPAYMDTCLLVPLYIEEEGSATAARLVAEFTRNGEIPLLVSELTKLEFTAVIARHMRIGILKKEEADHIIRHFECHCDQNFVVLPVQVNEFHTAQQWLRQLTTPLKAFDGLHMAIAHAANATLVTADKQLAGAAAMFDVEHRFAGTL